MEPSFIQHTAYHTDRANLVTIVSPHGSHGSKFWDYVPEILKEPAINENKELFLRYLAIEKDTGANELAHAIASHFVSIDPSYGANVIEFDYPRGIVDGGRILSHCIRDCLPAQLKAQLTPRLKSLHARSLAKLEGVYKELSSKKGLLLDIHTMAPYCPVDANGKAKTIPVSFDTLAAYVQQFIDAQISESNRRTVDLIISDPSLTKAIADQDLQLALQGVFSSRGIDFCENHPYFAEEHFLMYQHFVNAKAVAIDVPKDRIARLKGKNEYFDLADFELDQKKIDHIAEAIASALHLCLAAKR